MWPESLSNALNDNRAAAANLSAAGKSEAYAQSSTLSGHRRGSQQGLLKEGQLPDVQTREEIDAKIAASEARNDTKIARLEGKIDLLLEKATQAAAAAREEGRSTRANIVVLGTALALLIVAIVTLFPVFFDLGENIKGMVEQAVATRH